MGKLMKIFLIAATLLAILAVLLIAGLFYSVYQAVQPPQEFKVLEAKIIDDNGYPSLLVKFKTSKYPLDFFLYDMFGREVCWQQATRGESAIALSLVGMNPYTNIVGERNYMLKVFYLNNLIYEQDIRVQGVKPVIELVGVEVKKEEILGKTCYSIEYLKVRVRNEGDTPLYINNLNTHVLIDSESASVVVGGSIKTILPGEQKTIVLDILDKHIEKPQVIVELIIDGDLSDIDRVFTIDLENYVS